MKKKFKILLLLLCAGVALQTIYFIYYSKFIVYDYYLEPTENFTDRWVIEEYIKKKYPNKTLEHKFIKILKPIHIKDKNFNENICNNNSDDCRRSMAFLIGNENKLCKDGISSFLIISYVKGNFKELLNQCGHYSARETLITINKRKFLSIIRVRQKEKPRYYTKCFYARYGKPYKPCLTKHPDIAFPTTK